MRPAYALFSQPPTGILFHRLPGLSVLSQRASCIFSRDALRCQPSREPYKFVRNASTSPNIALFVGNLFRLASNLSSYDLFSPYRGSTYRLYSQSWGCNNKGSEEEVLATNVTTKEGSEPDFVSSFHGRQQTVDESWEGKGDDVLNQVTQCRMGAIHLVVGPMFAGKTTALLNRVQAEERAGRRVALVKSDKDTRYGLAAVVSHDGMQMPCWAVPTLSVFRASIGEEVYSKLDVIGIDESQFFEDLFSFCQVAADHEGKTLIVAGLDGDFLRKSFGSTLELIPLADSIVKLASRCELCGREAMFTLRKISDTKREVIGGADVYMPVCRQHYLSGHIVNETARTVLEGHEVKQWEELSVAEASIRA